MIVETFCARETWELGKKAGELAKPGMVIALDGDLGVGKTVFTQGFAAGLGIEEPVNSPTFTIVQVYEGGRLPFYHFDVYRIGDVEEMEEIGYEDCFYGEGVCLIEWADLIEEILPEHYTQIRIEKDLEKMPDNILEKFDYNELTNYEKIVWTRENLNVEKNKKSIKDELSEIVHHNSSYFISLNPYKYDIFSNWVFEIIKSKK